MDNNTPSLVMHEVREIETWILRLLSAPVPVPGKTRVEVRYYLITSMLWVKLRAPLSIEKRRKNRCETVISGLSYDRFSQLSGSHLQNVCETVFFGNVYMRRPF